MIKIIFHNFFCQVISSSSFMSFHELEQEILKKYLDPNGLERGFLIADLQKILMSLNDENIEEICSKLINSSFVKDKELLHRLVDNIFNCCKYRELYINQYVSLLFGLSENMSENSSEFKRLVFNINQCIALQPWRLYCISQCVHLFDSKDIYMNVLKFFENWNQNILDSDDNNEDVFNTVTSVVHINVFVYFAPLIEKNMPELFQKFFMEMKLKLSQMKLPLPYRDVITEIEKYKANNWENYQELLHYATESNTILYAIRKDDVSFFSEIGKSINPNLIYNGLINFSNNDDGNSPMTKINFNVRVKPSILIRFPHLNNKCTLLQWAAYWGAEQCFNFLLENGANPEETDEIGLDLMQYAVIGGTYDIIMKVQELGFSFEKSLPLIAECYRFDLFEYLISVMDFDLEESFLQTGTVFHRAASANNTYIILYCISKGINVNVFDNIQLTPLFYASNNGSIDVINILLSHKDINWALADKFLDTPLHGAAKKGDCDTFSTLMKHKDANVNVLDWQGRTALEYSLYEGKDEFILYVLHNYPNVWINNIDIYGENSLFCCLESLFLHSFKIFCDLPGLDFNVIDNKGVTVLHLSVKMNLLTRSCILLEKESLDPNILNKDGMPALHIAIQNGNDKIVQYFIKNPRTDMNLRNRNGYTALHVAIKYSQTKIISLLLDCDRVDKTVMYKNLTPAEFANLLGLKEIAEMFKHF